MSHSSIIRFCEIKSTCRIKKGPKSSTKHLATPSGDVERKNNWRNVNYIGLQVIKIVEVMLKCVVEVFAVPV